MLNMKNDKPVRAGQVFTVSLGVSGLERADATDDRLKVYALQVRADVACCLLHSCLSAVHLPWLLL